LHFAIRTVSNHQLKDGFENVLVSLTDYICCYRTVLNMHLMEVIFQRVFIFFIFFNYFLSTHPFIYLLDYALGYLYYLDIADEEPLLMDML